MPHYDADTMYNSYRCFASKSVLIVNEKTAKSDVQFDPFFDPKSSNPKNPKNI